MKSFSLVCHICGTVNQMTSTHCLACGQVLGAADDSALLTSAPTVSVRSAILLKQRYRVLHVIGKGGMGTVYIGLDTQLGNRLVAIKEMTQSGLPFAERQLAAQRFQQEAHLLAGLQHPHLPGIYDHFAEGQHWYLVMSFIRGQTLEAYLQACGGYLDVEEVVKIGLDLCSVLNYLHTYRPPIIFRDLKPSNIMRTVDGHIYLIDFGIARIFKPGQISDTTYQGSVGYAPPEQYGTSQTTPRSDIYALGATLYYLLTGYEPSATPFRLPPLRELVPAAPPQLVSLITAMLNLDEEKRPQRVEMVRRELQRIANVNTFPASPSPPPLSRSPSTVLEGRPRSVNKKKVSIIALSIVVVLASLLASYLIIGTGNANNSSASYAVVNTFCDVFNAASPDFSVAYQQLSASYQRAYSLAAFQTMLGSATHCTVTRGPDANYQAELDMTMPCIIPPDAPTPPGGGPLPTAETPVDVTLIRDTNSAWKIDTIYIATQQCGPPPRGRGANSSRSQVGVPTFVLVAFSAPAAASSIVLVGAWRRRGTGENRIQSHVESRPNAPTRSVS